LQFNDVIDAIKEAPRQRTAPSVRDGSWIRLLTAGLGDQFSNSDKPAAAYRQLAAQCQAAT